MLPGGRIHPLRIRRRIHTDRSLHFCGFDTAVARGLALDIPARAVVYKSIFKGCIAWDLVFGDHLLFWLSHFPCLEPSMLEKNTHQNSNLKTEILYLIALLNIFFSWHLFFCFEKNHFARVKVT